MYTFDDETGGKARALFPSSKSKTVRTAKQPLIERVQSGTIITVLTIGSAYGGIWTFTPLIALAILISQREFYVALRKAGYCPRPLIGYLSGLLFCMTATLYGIVPFDLTGAALCIALMITFVGDFWQPHQKLRLIDRALTFTGACYIGWLLSYHILILKLDTPLEHGWLSPLGIQAGTAWIYLALCINWMHDMTAFFVGRAWGRHKIAPMTSPKKSWEGFLAGLLASVVTAMLLVPILGLPITLPMAALVGGAGGVAALFGDLVVSLIKRQVGIKDMSSFVPGHGGLLDRTDSMLFSAPVIYYLVLLITWSSPFLMPYNVP